SFHAPTPTHLYTLSLHDALPILRRVVDPRVHPEIHPQQLADGEDRDDAGATEVVLQPAQRKGKAGGAGVHAGAPAARRAAAGPRSEEHTSELQSLTNLVCRLLLE